MGMDNVFPGMKYNPIVHGGKALPKEEQEKRDEIIKQLSGDRDVDQEKIKNGECASPATTDRCPYCIDTCNAAEYRKMKLIDHLNQVSVERGFENFRHATDGSMTYVLESIIEEAGRRFKNEK